jgi:hypothetical protein
MFRFPVMRSQFAVRSIANLEIFWTVESEVGSFGSVVTDSRKSSRANRSNSKRRSPACSRMISVGYCCLLLCYMKAFAGEG